MNRTLIEQNHHFISDGVNHDVFAISNKEKIPHEIVIGTNTNVDYILNDLNSNEIVNIILEDNSTLNLSLLLKNDTKNVKINAKLNETCKLIFYCADFSINNNNLEINVDLLGKASSLKWRLASLSAGNDKKEIRVNVNHLNEQTFAQVDNYGVSKDISKLLFAGTSYIANGSHNSKTTQNAKIMEFDETSIAIAKPILKIDENDIEASHSAGVGKISDEHLFYLTSRGITTIEARQLITLGYLKPVLNGFVDKEYQEEILKLIERRL